MERLNTFAGAEVRVRGYIESYYGPRIVLLNPQMLEVIGEADAPTERAPTVWSEVSTDAFVGL